MKELGTALAKAQGMMKTAIKDSTNPHFKSKYADLTSVWDACRDALSKNGLSVIQSTDFDGDNVWIKTILLHSSGECIEGRYPLRPQQQTPQGYGSAISYARRYALAAMVGVVADDDDGNAASQPRNNAPALVPVEDDQKAKGEKAAKAFVSEFIKEMGKATDPQQVDAMWLVKKAQLDRLKAAYPDQFRYLEAASQDILAAFIKDAAE